MKKVVYNVLIIIVLLSASPTLTVRAQEIPCQTDDDAARTPATYTDHTRPKYPMNMGPYSSQDKAVITKRLIEIEKIEEKSRANFQATGCVLRTSFNGRPLSLFGSTPAAVYGYQLAAYMNVCHVREHVIKTVDEYRTVLRVEINSFITNPFFYGQSSGDFYITDKRVRYDVPIAADLTQTNAGYLQTHEGSRISRLVAQDVVARNKSDFDKINNGNGWIEEVMAGYDPKKYLWLDRNWYITKNGLPLFVPVTRKEYLEALLEYYDIEKRGFQQVLSLKVRDDSRSTADAARQRMAIYDADRTAYQKIYDYKVTKIKDIINSHDTAWLKRQAIVKSKDLRENDYSKPSNGLFDFGQFADNVEGAHLLYQYNPEYFRNDKPAAAKPFFMRVQFRYEMGRYFSETLFRNFEKNFDFGLLRKMLE